MATDTANLACEPLTFDAVDNLAFAATRERLEPSKPTRKFQPGDLGPLLELVHASATLPALDPRRNRWIDTSAVKELLAATREETGTWISANRGFALIRITSLFEVADSDWIAYCFNAQRASETAGFSKRRAAQLVGALMELENNIHEHSGSVDSAFVAYKASDKAFEFVVSDQGMGVLASLRTCSSYAGLNDSGEALRIALADGASRYGPDVGRGMGFHTLFLGLANLHGILRFRSGDHALTIDGRSPTLLTAETAQKPTLQGFLISVKCLL